MKNSRWLVLTVALTMMAGTAGALMRLKARQHLGNPGVRIGSIPIKDPDGKIIAEQGVLLPEKVLGGSSALLPVAFAELNGLPKDTTFGKRLYRFANDFQVAATVVLMGTDRTSIHQPQFCLVGQGWSIDRTEEISIRVDEPFPCKIPALKLTTSIRAKDDQGKPIALSGIYIYWFVTENKITVGQGDRMWSMAKTLLEDGVLERWAYVSFFSTCFPGQEETTTRRLKEFISAAVPEFQLTTGQPNPVAAAKK